MREDDDFLEQVNQQKLANSFPKPGDTIWIETVTKVYHGAYLGNWAGMFVVQLEDYTNPTYVSPEKIVSVRNHGPKR